MLLIAIREISHLHSVLRQLCKSQQTLLKFLCLLTCFIKLLELLSIVNLVLQTSLHDLFPYLFNALDEERLEFISLSAHIDLISNLLLLLGLLSVNHNLEVSNRVRVTSLKSLHILDDLILHFLSLHP